jgi:group I intron endonuclease
MTKNLYAVNGINGLPNLPGVYLIRNVKTGRCYIGSAQNIRRRCRGHLGTIKRGCHENSKIRRDAAMYGPESFRFVALTTASTVREACLLEFHFRQLLGTADPDTGYDLSEKRGRTVESRLRMVEKRLSGSRSLKYCWLPGVSIDDPFDRTLLDTWEPNPPGMRY